MIVEAPKFQEVRFVCENLRPLSREDIFGVFDGTTDALAAWVMRATFSWAVYSDSAPAALIGAYEERPGVFGLFGMGTEGWSKVGKLVSLVARESMLPAVMATGARRAQCYSPESHRVTHRWLRMLGATHENFEPAFGRNGENYRQFIWVR